MITVDIIQLYGKFAYYGVIMYALLASKLHADGSCMKLLSVTTRHSTLSSLPLHRNVMSMAEDHRLCCTNIYD